jgi:fibronectin-binding autotransporter adhesin
MKSWFPWFLVRKPMPPVRRRRSASLFVEALEDRCVPATVVVNTLADSGLGSLRAAITVANDEALHPGADVITFAAGVTGTIVLDSALPDLSTKIDIQGPGASVLTVARSSAALTPDFRIFLVTSTVAISRLTLSNGNVAHSSGGGIRNEGTLTVTNSNLSGNSASLGGGIHNVGMLTLSDSTLSGNSAFNDGGGGIFNDGTLTLTNSTLGGNSALAGFGGGIVNRDTLTLSNSTLAGNSAGNAGGGIANDGTLTLSTSTLSGNKALSNDAIGGGIFNRGTLTLSTSTLSGNSAGIAGGGLFTAGGTATLLNATLTDNRSNFNNEPGVSGGGISRSAGTVTLHNTLVAGNFKGTSISPDDIFGGVAAGSSFNLVGVGAGLSGISNDSNGNQVGSALAPIDPRLGQLQNNGGPTFTHALRSGSPALDKGGFVAGLRSDQRGRPRVSDLGLTANAAAGDGSDIGAFEVQPAILTVNTLNDADVLDPVLSLREALLLSAGRLDVSALSALERGQIGGDPGGQDTVLFAPSVTGIIQLTRALPDLNSNLAIRGPGAGLLTVRRDTGGDYRIFTVTATASVLLSGLTLTNGKVLTDGGGLFNGGTLTLTRTTLEGNSAGSGGGLFNGSTLTLSNSTLAGNSATSSGGGIRNEGTLTLTNSTLSGNSARFDGGGLFTFGGTATLLNATLTDNRSNFNNDSSGSGGGIFRSSGILTLHNTIVAGNLTDAGTARDDLFGAVDSTSSFNLIGDGTSLSGISHNDANGNQVGSAQAPINPRLGPLQNNGGPTPTHALLSGSPAIDRGLAPRLAPATDQRGVGRSGAPDIGASEFIPPPAPPPPSPLPSPAQIVAVAFRRKGKARVRVQDTASGALRAVLTPFRGFAGRLRLQLLDVNGDGSLDLIVKALLHGKRKKRIFDAITLTPLPAALA